MGEACEEKQSARETGVAGEKHAGGAQQEAEWSVQPWADEDGGCSTSGEGNVW